LNEKNIHPFAAAVTANAETHPHRPPARRLFRTALGANSAQAIGAALQRSPSRAMAGTMPRGNPSVANVLIR